MSAYAVTATAEGAIEGVRCVRCQKGYAPAVNRCPGCGAAVAVATFRPTGTIWSYTILSVAVGALEPPVSFVYVDLPDGPRLLARWVEAGVAPAGVAEAHVWIEDGQVLARPEVGA